MRATDVLARSSARRMGKARVPAAEPGARRSSGGGGVSKQQGPATTLKLAKRAAKAVRMHARFPAESEPKELRSAPAAWSDVRSGGGLVAKRRDGVR